MRSGQRQSGTAQESKVCSRVRSSVYVAIETSNRSPLLKQRLNASLPAYGDSFARNHQIRKARKAESETTNASQRTALAPSSGHGNLRSVRVRDTRGRLPHCQEGEAEG